MSRWHNSAFSYLLPFISERVILQWGVGRYSCYTTNIWTPCVSVTCSYGTMYK